MLEHVDRALWNWGDWARGHRVGRPNRLTMNYRPRGVMGTNPHGDNSEAERIDALIAKLPPYMEECRQAIKHKYLFAWRDEDSARALGTRRSTFGKLIDHGHYYLAALLE